MDYSKMTDQELVALGIRHRTCAQDRSCEICGALTCIYCAALVGICREHYPLYRPTAAELAEDARPHPEDLEEEEID